jgi:hypothetical protein
LDAKKKKKKEKSLQDEPISRQKCSTNDEEWRTENEEDRPYFSILRSPFF